jgi:adenylosuccinate synthase
MNTILLGAQWGDEGKGKVVDRLSGGADLVVRFQGGNNAGHSLWVGGQKTVLHLIPSGILHPHTQCLIAEGVVLDPVVLFREIAQLKAAGVFQDESTRIRVSERTHLILPILRETDLRRERQTLGTAGHIGTTGRGIGPAYEAKARRVGLRVIDLFGSDSEFEQKLDRLHDAFSHLFTPAERVDLKARTFSEVLPLREALAPLLVDTTLFLKEAHEAGKRILFEGAQGVMLDLDHGTYPYVTSSFTTSPGAGIGAAFPRITRSAKVLGIAKVYVTRVGSGDFPTEMRGDWDPTEVGIGEAIRKAGGEFGATTGRPRRIGWQDLVALRYAVDVAGIDELALMKGDVLCGLEELGGEFRACVAYETPEGKRTTRFPARAEDLCKMKPVYERFQLWQKAHPSDSAFLAFLERIEDFLGIPVRFVGYGPDREQMVERKEEGWR